MRALHSSSANIQRRTNPLIDSERFRSNRRANNIDQRVYRSDLMEVNALDAGVVNLRLGRAQIFEDRNRRLLRRLADRRRSDDLANLFQTASMHMLVACSLCS